MHINQIFRLLVESSLVRTNLIKFVNNKVTITNVADNYLA